jgi:hypothetical protein
LAALLAALSVSHFIYSQSLEVPASAAGTDSASKTSGSGF